VTPLKKIIALLIICQLTFGFIDKNILPDKSTVTFKSLLNEMCDRGFLANYPDPSYHLFQASSWDREELQGKGSKGWFANKDYDNYIRKETNGKRTEYVLMDVKGPGAITKWWFPQIELLGSRIVRIYLDNKPEPVIEENYEKFINGSAFVKWPFAFISSDEKDAPFQYTMPVGLPKQVGSDFYLPIPFSKACKVTLDDSVFYYNINYRIYERGTKVVSFTKKDYNNTAESQNTAARKLLSAGKTLGASFKKNMNITKDQSIEIDLPSGTHAINGIYLKINSANNKQMNRAAIVQVIVDDHRTVWSPVSEFFGGGVYARPVKNRNIEVTADGWMISHFVMPYKKSARVILKNFGEEPIKAELKASVENYRWSDNSLYFHAGWHEEAPLSKPNAKDWNYIEIKGKGEYVGDVLTVYSTPKAWWGEGDEKIYINGESFPSQLGTGLEDYYGFAWGLANHFNSPFISMPLRDARGKDNWSGYNTVARMRFLDDIPFDTSLKVDIEAMIPEPGVSFSVTCFWYGMNPAADNIVPDSNTVTRRLPDFGGITLQKLPGETYPDPPQNKSLIGKAKGSLAYAGDQLDLLAWKDKNVRKKYDGDGDNILGTAGYCIFGNKIISTYTSIADTGYKYLPSFISHLTPQHVINQSGAYIPVDGKKDVMNQTGLIEVPGSIAENGLVSFTISKSVPSSFRLGVMLDNAGVFTKIGKYLWVTDSRNGNSGKVLLAKSNRVPDWYFFDVKGLQGGDSITVHGSTANDSDTFTIGALTFDLNKTFQ
jgi:hypothetical protein